MGTKSTRRYSLPVFGLWLLNIILLMSWRLIVHKVLRAHQAALLE